MTRAYSDITFTPAVLAMQTSMGSRSAFAPLDHVDDRRDALTAEEAEFIHARDGFYQATVNESGWPYVQFRGGPAGFLKVLDSKTIGYADFRGNVQYISAGNLLGNDRVSIILMDYASQRRLKILGRVRLVSESEDPALMARLELPNYRAQVERAVVVTVEAYDWNCPQHITPRFTETEIEEAVAPLHAELARLREGRGSTAATHAPLSLGDGPLALRISGMRQLTPRVRAYELRSSEGAELPAVRAGSHIDLPVRLETGLTSTRRYSISSNARPDAYEVAVLREDTGSGGSTAVHAEYRLGLVLHARLPGNDFPLHDDDRPAILIAGGIGITPIKAMVHELCADSRRFELHYAARSRVEAAYVDDLECKLGTSLRVYAADRQQRLDVPDLMARAPADAMFYVCGPARLIDAVRDAARVLGLDDERVRFERFVPAPSAISNRPLTVTLERSGKRIAVPPEKSILEVVEATGVQTQSGCRSGTCGTCRVKVLGGEPEHRDAALSDAERGPAGLMCICVSRAKSAELALDL
jgi:ferredoxin-NADP reductase/predicted pyridoxine 5'-phosphate oxidase superfamily flavin-nucleotide-binding protein